MLPSLLHSTLGHYRTTLRRGTFGHSVMIMFAGSALGQCLSVLCAPVLTRLYTPAMFGALGNFTSLIAIAAVVASLRYEMALPLAKSKEEAANLLAVCGIALLLTTLLLWGLLLCCPAIGTPASAFGTLLPYRALLPIGFFCVGAYQILVYLGTWQGDYSSIARTKLYQGAAGPLTQIALGLSSWGIWGLLSGFIVGQSAGTGLLFNRLVLKTAMLRQIRRQGMKAIAMRYIRFPLLSSWSGLINTLGSSCLLLVVVPVLYSNTIAGFVFLADRIIGRPLLLISTSILQVYLGDVSRSLTHNPAGIKRRFLRLAFYQFLIVASWLAVVNIAAPYVFPFAFGPRWAGAVLYLHIMSIAYLPQMVISALAHTLQVLEKLGLSAVWETVRLIAVAGAFAASYHCGMDAAHGILLYSLAQGSMQAVLFLLMYHAIQSLQNAHRIPSTESSHA